MRKLDRAERLFALAERLADPGVLLQAHHCLWATRFDLGDFQGSWQHIEAGLKLYGEGDYSAHADFFGGHDARVCGSGEAALVFWHLGQPERALRFCLDALEWSERLGHAGSQLHALDIAVTFRRYRREPEAARDPGAAHDRARPRARARRSSGQGPAVSRLDRRRRRASTSEGIAMIEEAFAIERDVRHARRFPDLLRHPGRDAGRGRPQPGPRWTKSSGPSPNPRSAPGRSGCPSCTGAAARCCWRCRRRAPTRRRLASARR